MRYTGAMRTPLTDCHIALGAKMAPFAGWEMPIVYRGIIQEHQYTREVSSIFDICHMGEFEFKGPTACADLDRLLTLNVAALKPGACTYGYLLNDNGCALDDLICFRFGEDHFWLVVNAGTTPTDAAWIQARLSPQTQFTDLSPRTAKLDIQGPQTRAEMEKALGLKLPDLKYFHFQPLTLLGHECVLSRTGYTGEFGYELFTPMETAEQFWTLFLEHSAIQPAGLGARDSLRVEMGYPLYGHELRQDVAPLSAGHGKFIDLNKEFIGKDAIKKELASLSRMRLIGLVLESRSAARPGDVVVSDGQEVGIVTSGLFSPSLNVAVALAEVRSHIDRPGGRVSVKVRDKLLNATVTELPFYKQGTARKKY